MYEQIDYANVTLDLRQYLLSGRVEWQNASSSYLSSDSMHHFEVFDGFLYSTFLKCFTIQYAGGYKRKVKAITFDYDKLRLEADWPSKSWDGFIWSFLKITVIIHYPGQLYLYKNNEVNNLNMYGTEKTIVLFQDLEILKSRNSRKRLCSMHTDNYDNIIVDKKLSRVKCRPPYFKSHKTYGKCNSQKRSKRVNLNSKCRKKWI